MWATFNRLQLRVSTDDASSGSHQGDCYDDVQALARKPYIKWQLDKLTPDKVSAELAEYGAWDAEQLADHDENLLRLLWLACCDIRERTVH